jgi:hypothetical protein
VSYAKYMAQPQIRKWACGVRISTNYATTVLFATNRTYALASSSCGGGGGGGDSGGSGGMAMAAIRSHLVDPAKNVPLARGEAALGSSSLGGCSLLYLCV